MGQTAIIVSTFMDVLVHTLSGAQLRQKLGGDGYWADVFGSGQYGAATSFSLGLPIDYELRIIARVASCYR